MDRRFFLRSIAAIPAVGLINFKIPQEPIGLDAELIENLCGGFGDCELILIIDKTCTPLKNNKYKLWETTYAEYVKTYGEQCLWQRFNIHIHIMRRQMAETTIFKLDKPIGLSIFYMADKVIEINDKECNIIKNRQDICGRRSDFSRLDIL